MGVEVTIVELLPYKNPIKKSAKEGKILEALTELKIRKDYHNTITKYKKKADCIINLYEPLPKDFNLKDSKTIYITSCNQIYGNGSYNVIKFQPKFYKMAQKIVNYPKDSVIGIHIRRTDASEENIHSPSELFVKKMEESIKKNSSVKFFVSTDDEVELKELKERFGEERILSQSKTYERISLRGQQEAVIDLLCLSCCSKIYGCAYSSFCYVASRIGNIELERIGKRRE